MDIETTLDVAQTAALIATMGVLLWGVVLLRRELIRASAALEAALRGQKEIQEGLDEVKKRLEELEKKDRARQIDWLNREDEAKQPDDDGCGFSRAMPPVTGQPEDDGE